MRLPHFRFQSNDRAVDGEGSIATVMEGLGFLLGRVDPRIHDLQNEEIVPLDQGRILDSAFEVAEAFLDQGWADVAGRKGRQSEVLELIDVLSGAIADFYHLADEAARRDRDHGFARRAESREAEVGFTDGTSDERRLKLDHHVP